MRSIVVGIAAFLTLSFIVAATLAQLGMMGDRGMMRGKGMMRRRFVMMNGIGEGYVSKANALPPTAGNITSGSELHAGNCAACHGVSGRGDGEAGKGLNPRPANIAAFSKTPMASDGYLYWTIACQWFYECESCHTLLKPKPGDCCVYCAYGSAPCPPVQQARSCCKS